MDFHGPARPLADSDVKTIAGYLGCHVAAVRAVLIVESAGKGFSADNRPLILNEPHVLYRELSGTARQSAVNAGLAYKSWGARPYLKTQDARYNWLDSAIQISIVAALRSCSWGLGQVMGFNHKVCGFNTVQAFVRAQLLSEGAHLYTMARFIVGNKLQRHLRNLNWARFAKGYNGPGYAKNAYHTKLANAYDARPITEKYTPKPATAAELAAMIAAEPEPPAEPAPKPVAKPPVEAPVEPPETVLRTTQPSQPPPETEHPWLAVAAAVIAALAPIIMLMLE